MAKKLRNPLAFYGFREQNVFNSYENNSSKQSKEIDELRKKNEEQDKRDDDFDYKIQENNKKDEKQDEDIRQAIDKSTISLEMLSTPSEGSCRTYTVKQGGNSIGNIEIPFSSLVKSTTYDPENNLLIFTVDDGKEIKVDLTKLIEDSDLVQRKIFDDFKNEFDSFSSNTVDSISELSVATSSSSDKIKELEQKMEDTSYTTAKALNKLNDDIEDAFDSIEENSIKIKNIEEDNSASNASLNELSTKVETFSSETENKINNLKEDVDNKFYVVSKSVNDVNDKLNDFEDETNEKFKSIDKTLEDKSYTISKSINDVNDKLEDFEDDANEKFKSIDKTFEDNSYVVSKALNELKDGLEDAIDESMVIRGTGENSTILKNSGSIAKGKDSIALGTNLVTENENEIALGKYNNSSSDTVFSFGIGTSDNDRKNAIEIKNDGNIYLWSEGSYVCLNEIIGRVDVGETY